MTQQPNLTDPLQARQYPAPAPVHWAVLLIASIIFETVVQKFTRSPESDFANTVFFGAWSIYLCLWIRKQDPRAISIYSASFSFVLLLVSDAFDAVPNQSRALQITSVIVVIVGVASSLVSIFQIRGELLKHYNEREPIGLSLGPIMTFFFSFCYFQYHLYQIAQFKDRQARGVTSDPSRTLLS